MDEKQIRDIAIKVIRETSSIPIGVSGRHVHLCRLHMDILFGKGSELNPKKELMGGQFAALECVALVGKNYKTIPNVRVLGPLRQSSQVEISKTDSFTLGLSAPIRDSGDTKNSAPITLIGPYGAINLSEGCIIARRHIHMPPGDAVKFCVKDKDIVRIKTEGVRSGIFDSVLIRVDESFTLEMHIDTDEANAFDISTNNRAIII